MPLEREILYNPCAAATQTIPFHTTPPGIISMAKNDKLKLEETLSQLETTIAQLDEEQLSVAESLAAFETGLKLIRKAQKELQDAEQRVVALIEEGGEPMAKPFLEDSGE